MLLFVQIVFTIACLFKNKFYSLFNKRGFPATITKINEMINLNYFFCHLGLLKLFRVYKVGESIDFAVGAGNEVTVTACCGCFSQAI